MAYVVGLMATDGCLISGKRVLNFKSEDEQLVQTFLRCLGRRNHYRTIVGRTGNLHYVTQFGDAALYVWLQGVGLMPRKSLILGALAVPDDVVLHCVRGLLDGDGSVINYWYDGGGKAAGGRYEGLTTRFVSASKDHIDWLRPTLLRALGIEGSISAPAPPRGCWGLNYAIRESCILLPRLYPSEDVPKLERKWRVWRNYAMRHGHAATLDDVRPASGWPHDVSRERPSRDSKGRFRTLSRRSSPVER